MVMDGENVSLQLRGSPVVFAQCNMTSQRQTVQELADFKNNAFDVEMKYYTPTGDEISKDTEFEM